MIGVNALIEDLIFFWFLTMSLNAMKLPYFVFHCLISDFFLVKFKLIC